MYVYLYTNLMMMFSLYFYTMYVSYLADGSV